MTHDNFESYKMYVKDRIRVISIHKKDKISTLSTPCYPKSLNEFRCLGHTKLDLREITVSVTWTGNSVMKTQRTFICSKDWGVERVWVLSQTIILNILGIDEDPLQESFIPSTVTYLRVGSKTQERGFRDGVGDTDGDYQKLPSSLLLSCEMFLIILKLGTVDERKSDKTRWLWEAWS